MAITYHRLEAGDLARMRSLNEVFARAFADPETHLTKPPSDIYLKNLLAKDTFIALAAFADERVVGGLVAYTLEKYEQERSEIYIYDLAVEESSRRRGIARGLIQELKRIGKGLGAWAIFVQADKVDTPAVKLYESMGVAEEPIHFDIYLDR